VDDLVIDVVACPQGGIDHRPLLCGDGFSKLALQFMRAVPDQGITRVYVSKERVLVVI
jgi:hypothetical protein